MKETDELIFDAYALKEGDQVECVRSNIKGRKGTVYTISKWTRPTSREIRLNIVSKRWIILCSMYGDSFKRVGP